MNQIFDRTKWPTLLVRKEKMCNIKAYFCGLLYFTFKTTFITLFIDQLARSKAMCPFTKQDLTSVLNREKGFPGQHSS